ncbi:AAA family ATPase, partial [Salsipaludibacter albus]|uniref:AAA family ATPase n=1 Tax=Salsipaludibacter albus TaxID=2849650 RepID=UPI001EE3CF65
MRPTRLDLEGFASFRQPTSLDFTDADLFVLSGPTGSGKSSIIDAMTFALYGVVARYGDKRLVAPVISNGRNEARVRLAFAVGDDHYTAVRVVRRTATGASTKEARLERWRGDDPDDAVVVAATADELTEAVETVLGLGYEHFTTTVVLPQGAFQRFLHARASERQGLLVELLDLAVFGRIGQAARTRATTAEARAGVLAQQLDAAGEQATDEAVEAAASRVEALATAIAQIDDARPELDEILAEGRAQADRVTELERQVAALDAVEAPDDLAELAARESAAAESLEEGAVRRSRWEVGPQPGARHLAALRRRAAGPRRDQGGQERARWHG